MKCAWCKKEIFTDEYTDQGEIYCKECYDKWREAVKKADKNLKEWKKWCKEHEDEHVYTGEIKEYERKDGSYR